jgi:DNA-binding NtrC family response regulator
MTDDLNIPHDDLTVLIVEDEQRLRQLLVDVLPDMGFTPVGVGSGEHGLRAVAEQQVDIIMLDLNLPGMDGMEFLETLRQKQPETPVIIMTGFGSLENAQQAIRFGVVDFLTKPCHLGEIEAALDRARRGLQTAPEVVIDDDRGDIGTGADPKSTDTDAAATLAELEKRAILEALRRNDNNRSKAAAELGISRRTLYNRLAEYGLL